MAGRLTRTRGRQKISISRIQNQDDLYATFSKRRLGLYNKASQLSNLCGVDIGVILFSPNNIPYSFFHPNMDSVVESCRKPNQPRNAYTRVVESTTRSRIEALNKNLDEILEEKQQLEEQSRRLKEIDRKGWCEESAIESLNKEQVKEWINCFQALKAQVDSRIDQLQNGVGPNILAPGPSSLGIEQYPAHNPPFASQFNPSTSHTYVLHGNQDCPHQGLKDGGN